MGNVLNKQYATNLQQSMRLAASGSWEEVAADLKYDLVANTFTDEADSIQLIFPISGAQVQHGVDEAEIPFSKLEEKALTFNYAQNALGLKVSRNRFTDGDRGAKQAADWARAAAASAAYMPERLVWEIVNNGDSVVGQVDGVPLFSKAHPHNPGDTTGYGTYSNLFSGAAASGSSNNPGALKIDSSVSFEVAVQNLGTALAGIKRIKCPDGVTPRRLKPIYLFVPIELEARATMLTGPTGLFGATDYSPIIKSAGLTVVTIPELTGTSFYIGCEEVAGSPDAAAVSYWLREPFSIKYFDMTDAQLDAANELQWHGRGRDAAFPGAAPFKLIKVSPT
jgi:hypothetical protein